jgi:AmmeMemoRadiSam system protein A
MPTISRADGLSLVALARASVVAAARGDHPPVPPQDGVYARHAGAFVSLHRGGDLRGCIGQPEPGDPLGELIVHCAGAAALEDPRFPPVQPDELPALHVEVSVLTPPVPVADLSTIVVGRHGLIVSRGGRRALLLPQVAVEWKWTREELLAQTCRKAGLPADAWQHGAEVFAFEAEIFSEENATSR